MIFMGASSGDPERFQDPMSRRRYAAAKRRRNGVDGMLTVVVGILEGLRPPGAARGRRLAALRNG